MAPVGAVPLVPAVAVKITGVPYVEGEPDVETASETDGFDDPAEPITRTLSSPQSAKYRFPAESNARK
jgi:hypothetical protein